MVTVRASDCHPVECEETQSPSGLLNVPARDIDVSQHRSRDDGVCAVQVLGLTPTTEFGPSAILDDAPDTDGRTASSTSKSTTIGRRQCIIRSNRSATLKRIVADLEDEMGAIIIGVKFPTIPSFRSAMDMVRAPIDPILL